MSRTRLGRKGEILACLHLKKKGFSILCRNYRIRVGEIDIVALKKNLLVFCEVKTRLNKEFGEPFEAVTNYKKRRLKKLAQAYLQANQPHRNKEARFDIISICFGNKQMEFKHIENAF